MSRLYGVVTTVSGDKVRRASRVGEDSAHTDISTDVATYRLGICDDEVYLLRIGKRWKAADATPESEWEELFTVEETAEEITDDPDPSIITRDEYLTNPYGTCADPQC